MNRAELARDNLGVGEAPEEADKKKKKKEKKVRNPLVPKKSTIAKLQAAVDRLEEGKKPKKKDEKKKPTRIGKQKFALVEFISIILFSPSFRLLSHYLSFHLYPHYSESSTDPRWC